MLSASLAILIASAVAADLPPEALVERLGSPDRVEREEAARTLEEQGPDALPALRAARDTAQSPEASGRLADLIARVEARLLDRPTLVTLDFDDLPLGEAVKALAARTGFAIVLDDPALASRRVSARAAGLIPFWEALDRLGRAGHVRHDPGSRLNSTANDRQTATIRLVDGDPPAFTTYAGPLRIHLLATHWHRDIAFAPARVPDARPYRTTVSVEVQAFAEPGRFIEPAGAAELVAVDDQGRALAPQPGGGEWVDTAERSWLIPGRLSLQQWHSLLGVPASAKRTPLKLRGALSVVISVRQPDPLVIPLADAARKTFRLDQGVVQIETISPQGAGGHSVTFVLSDESNEADRRPVSSGPQPDHLSELAHVRLEFEDAEGHPMSWIPPNPRFGNSDSELRAQVHVSGRSAPARLRVYRLNRLATKIPFSFEDVPAP